MLRKYHEHQSSSASISKIRKITNREHQPTAQVSVKSDMLQQECVYYSVKQIRLNKITNREHQVYSVHYSSYLFSCITTGVYKCILLCSATQFLAQDQKILTQKVISQFAQVDYRLSNHNPAKEWHMTMLTAHSQCIEHVSAIHSTYKHISILICSISTSALEHCLQSQSLLAAYLMIYCSDSVRKCQVSKLSTL